MSTRPEQSIRFLRSLRAADTGTTIYQQTIDDVLAELDERDATIAALREDLAHMTELRDALVKHVSDYEPSTEEAEAEIASLRAQVETLTRVARIARRIAHRVRPWTSAAWSGTVRQGA